MKRVKRRTFAGVICEQEVYSVADGAEVKTARPPRPRFKNEEDRQRHKDLMSLRRFVNRVNENFGPSSFYLTLTFDMDNECHSPAECRQLMQRYIRRLKYRHPEAVIAAVYGQGKTTARFHIHMITEGIPEETLKSRWTYGEVKDCRHLREHNFYNGVDHGRDYTALATYLFLHWRPEYGGHRWYLSRNAREPEREAPAEVKREYNETHPPIAPKGYMLVESRGTPYGYYYFKYVKIPEAGRSSRAGSPKQTEQVR